ncbi:unnamed protein product [Cylindrotheca closterium]|uniref:Calmodulin-lysine N-methyltransferase n=1 Tax=Cylindrotheca closterium TaxID=2856 RepID=A0AAD2FDI3_9STRA|nr:unnamed protein product [Cylindrotheca closterium]
MSATKDKKWTDDSIRWPEDQDKNKENEEEEEEEEGPMDIFKDPDPTESFHFKFEVDKLETVEIELDGYKAESDEIWQSTGLTIWKASEYLCHYIVKHKDDEAMDLSMKKSTAKDKRRVLELGAGLGLVGILAHRIASPQCEVILTDGDSEALPHLRENVDENKDEQKGQVLCQQLIWGEETSLEFLELQKKEKFDVILASDIVYSPVIIKPLWETIQILLEPNGTFLMAYAKRQVPVEIGDVLSAATEAGFVYQECKESDHEKGVFVYTFQWNGIQKE